VVSRFASPSSVCFEIVVSELRNRQYVVKRGAVDGEQRDCLVRGRGRETFAR